MVSADADDTGGAERHIRIILQSRTTSSRLPAKCLLPIAGLPIAVLAAKRVGNTGLPVTIATSDDPTDDVLVTELTRHGLNVFRGSLNNVLERFVGATAEMSANDVCVRLTADNVLPDGAFVQAMIDEFLDCDAAYLSSAKGMPYGLAAEVFRVGALREALSATDDAYDLEHVTPWIKRTRPCMASSENLGLVGHDDVRATIDTFDDYLLMATVFQQLPIDQDAVRASCSELAKLVIANSPSVVKAAKAKDTARAPLIFGAAQAGMGYGRLNKTGKPSVERAVELIKHAVSLGIVDFDTARAYDDSERKIGAALQATAPAGCRVTTKLSPLSELASDASHDVVRGLTSNSVFQSLYHLKAERLQTLLLHRASHMRAFDGEIWRHLKMLRNDGLIGKLGVSVQSPEEIEFVLQDKDVEHIQLPYNILDRRWDDFFNKFEKPDYLTIHVRSVFLQGILLTDNTDQWPQIERPGIEMIPDMTLKLANDFGRSGRNDLCVAFVRATDWVDGVVIGMETREQITSNKTLFDAAPLTADQLAVTRAVFSDLPEQLLNPALWPSVVAGS